VRRAGYSRAAPPCLVDKGEVGMCIDGLAKPLQPLGGTTSCSTHSVKRRAAEELPEARYQARWPDPVATEWRSRHSWKLFPFPRDPKPQ
jgi:hypothetical protein